MDSEGFITTAKNKYGSLTIFRNNRANAVNLARIISNLTYEIEVTKVLEAGGYDLFIDIGASFGYYTRIAASKSPVVAFEPHPIVFGFLKWNTRDLKNVSVFPQFVGNADAYIPEEKVSSMVGTKRGPRTQSFEVCKITIDEIFEKYPREFSKPLIKIDVEGFELDVISTGLKALASPNTRWIVELHPWATTEQQLLKVFDGYKHRILTPRTKSTVYLFERES